MTTFSTLNINDFKNIDSARSAAFRKKQQATKAGWTNVQTKRDQENNTLMIIGDKPSAAPAETQAETKSVLARKKPVSTSEAPKESKKPSSKTAKDNDKTKNRDGLPRISTGKSGPRPVGQTTGVGVEQTWGLIFEREERKAPEKRLKDAAIAAEMTTQFPGRNSRVFSRVAEVRTKWRKKLFGYQKRGESAAQG